MGLTLNIIEHELKPFGSVVRALEDNPSFQSARLFLEGRAFSPGILYVCQTPDEVREVRAAGCHAVFASDGSADDEATGGAAITVIGKASAFVVFDALLESFSRFAKWTTRMDRICQTGGTLQELINESEPFLINNVVVLDPALKLLGYTKSIPCDDPITMELIEHGYHTEDNIRKFKLHKRFKPWAEAKGFVVNESREICKYVTVVRSFTSRSAFSLIVVMMCNRLDPEPFLLDAYEMFVDRVGFYALRDYPGDKPSGSEVDTLLKDLFSGHIKDEAVVSERCRYVGIPMEARFTVYYLPVGDASVPSRRLLTDVSRVVAPAKTILLDNAIVVLCFSSSYRDAQLWNEPTDAGAMTGIDERLTSMMNRYELSCGKSSAFSLLSKAATAYRQAQQAYELGKEQKRQSGRAREGNRKRIRSAAHSDECIFCFDELSVDYLASLLSAEQAEVLAATRAGALLAAIKRADLRSNTDNYEFLRDYLLYERRGSTVAEKLHMHRNNVSYRIGRIEQQYGIDTSDPTLRLELFLAYQLREAFIGRFAQ